jgi:hypothetical protein
MPTTGEYGPKQGFGDYEEHQRVATRIGGHFTFSPEDRQSQPARRHRQLQIRLSNGTVIFTPGALAPDVAVERSSTTWRTSTPARSGGLRARGRVLPPLAERLPSEDLAGARPSTTASRCCLGMVLPQTVQLYTWASYIFGDFGDSWEMTRGINWWVFPPPRAALNLEYIYITIPDRLHRRPQQVGATARSFTTNLEMSF